MIKAEQKKSPIFEMILQSTGETRFASALPSVKHLPEDWHKEHQEGQLAVDIAESESELFIVSTMAGAELDKIEVYIHNDLLTIRGERKPPVSGSLNFHHQECFWGKFSRTIVLPTEVKADLARAEYKNGILIIKVPKRKIDAKIPVVIVDE